MADNVEKIILDDSQILGALDRIIKLTKDAEASWQKYNETVSDSARESSKGLRASIEDVIEKLNDQSENQRKNMKATEDGIKSSNKWGISLDGVSDKLTDYKNKLIEVKNKMSIFGNSTSNSAKGLTSLTRNFGGAKKAMVGFASGLKLVGRAIALSGIGLLVIALAAVAYNLKQTKEGTDLIKKGFIAVGATINVLLERFSNFGGAMIKLFKGDFQGAVDGIKESVAGIGDAISKEIDVLTDIMKRTEALIVSQRKLTKEMIVRNNQIKILREEEEKSNTTSKRRIEILKEIAKTENELNNLATENASEQLQLLEDGNKSIEEKANAENDLINIAWEGIQTQRQIANEIQEIRDNDRKEFLKKKAEEEKERLEALAQGKKLWKQLAEIGIANKSISKEGAFQFTTDKQIKALDEIMETLITIQRITGKDMSIGFKLAQDSIDKLEFNRENRALDLELEANLKIDAKKIDVELTDDTDFDLTEVKWFEGVDDFEKLFQTSLDELFGQKNGKKAREFFSGLGSLLSEFGQIANEANAIQIDAIDKQLDRLGEKREELQSELDGELEDQAKGLANNVGNKQEEVDNILAEEARLQQEKDKIQAEAQRRQLLFDTAQQTQSFITSAINIIKGFSNIPIFGLPLGIAAVGTMAAFFAKTKVDAFKATKLSKGAQRIDDHFGFGDRHGDTDLEGRGEGYELVSRRTGKRTNTVISGREMLLPEDISLSNEQFFNSMRNGLYNGIDLNEAVAFYMNQPSANTRQGSSIGRSKVNHIDQRKNGEYRQYIPFTDKKGVQKAVLVTIKPNDANGNIVIFEE